MIWIASSICFLMVVGIAVAVATKFAKRSKASVGAPGRTAIPLVTLSDVPQRPGSSERTHGV